MSTERRTAILRAIFWIAIVLSFEAVAVVRVEQLYPWPGDQIADAVARYPNVTSVVWVQEEPENMGPWPFAGGRLSTLFADRYDVTCSTRRESGSPATGSLTVHQQEQEELVARALNLAG